MSTSTTATPRRSDGRGQGASGAGRVVIPAEAVFLEARRRHLNATEEREKEKRKAEEAAAERKKNDEAKRVQDNIGLTLGVAIALCIIAAVVEYLRDCGVAL